MPFFRCYQCVDRSGPQPLGREFEGDAPSCPRCGAGWPAVMPLVAVHLLVPDPKGLIQGQAGRFRVACDAKRDRLAVMGPGGLIEDYHASGDAAAISCRACRGTKEFAALLAANEELRDKLRRQAALDALAAPAAS